MSVILNSPAALLKKAGKKMMCRSSQSIRMINSYGWDTAVQSLLNREKKPIPVLQDPGFRIPVH